MSGMSFGNRSLERTICLCASYKALNVWKNSSCVRSFPRQELNVVDHQHVDMPVSLPQVHHLVGRMELMTSFVNCSVVR